MNEYNVKTRIHGERFPHPHYHFVTLEANNEGAALAEAQRRTARKFYVSTDSVRTMSIRLA